MTITITWSTEDVQSIRPDLNDAHAYEVLLHAKDKHDATVGINWDVLQIIADEMFPQP